MLNRMKSAFGGKKLLIGLTSSLIGLAMFATPALAVTSTDLVGWWKIDETSLVTAADSSLNPIDGTLTGGSTFTSGFVFSGHDYVSIPEATKLDVTNQITLSATINITDLPDTYSAVISKGPSHPGSYMMHLDKRDSGHYRVCPVFYIGGSYGNWEVGCSNDLLFNQTYNVAVSYDGTTEKTFVDGLLQGSETRGGNIDNVSGPVEIGHDSRYPYDTRYVQGKISNVQIWNVTFPQTPENKLCTPTGFYRDGLNLTAAQIGGDVTGSLNATNCNIGVYYGPDSKGLVNNADIFGSNYYGVVNQKGAVNVTDSEIHQIGETPFNGNQHGVGIYYANIDGLVNGDCSASGETTGVIENNTIYHYQKGGIVVSCAGAIASIMNNTVTGLGPVDFIAQNGIQFGYGASGEARGNLIDGGNEYTGTDWTSTGLLLFDVNANQVKTSNNKFINNQKNYALVTSQACPHQYGGFYETYSLCLFP